MVIAEMLDGAVKFVAETKKDKWVALCQLQVNHMVESFVLDTKYLNLKFYLNLRKLSLFDYLIFLVYHLGSSAPPHITFRGGCI
jgi:hypothetical protein